MREFVTKPWDGEYDRRLPGISFKLLPQAGDMNIYGAGKSLGAVAPNFLEYFIAREGGPAMLKEIAKQLELASRECNYFPIP